MDYGTIIIGGGVIGLACAVKLSGAKISHYPHFNKKGNVLLVERHPSFGYETSSRNSEVIHAGIYYPKDSLKAKLCVLGKWKLYEWCAKHRVPVKRIGKFIVSPDARHKESEVGSHKSKDEQLYEIFKRGIANGVEGLELVSRESVNCEEPYIKAKSAIWSPNTGIIDSHALMQSFVAAAEENGCDFAWMHTCKNISHVGDGYNVGLLDPYNNPCTVSAESVINAAGLDSDLIAENAGIDIDKYDYRLNWCRGHYFRISSAKKHLARHLIYPVPPENTQGLGIHVTIEMSGELKLGPDTQYLSERKQDYIVPETLKEKFYNAASFFIAGLALEDISPDQSGIRPKLQKEGGEFRDFIIKEESDKGLPGFINLIGIESPGLTCCLEIAEIVNKCLGY